MPKPKPKLVRVNSIHSPSEEMKELKDQIKHEANLRKSIRLQANPAYVKGQVDRLNEQINNLQKRIEEIQATASNAGQRISESEQRSIRAEKRLAELRNRVKIERFAELYIRAEAMKQELGL